MKTCCWYYNSFISGMFEFHPNSHQHLTQGHFIVGIHARIESHASLWLKVLDPVGIPRALSKEQGLAKKLLPRGWGGGGPLFLYMFYSSSYEYFQTLSKMLKLHLSRGVRLPNECPDITINYLMVRFKSWKFKE